MDRIRTLLVNPPIYDFTAYDFWLRPYGLLRTAGRLRHACELTLYDYLVSCPRDRWGRGRFPVAAVHKPKEFEDIPRRFRRYGRPREEFREFLRRHRFDAALIQTMMTYWYPGVREVIEDLRELQPDARLVLGGVSATLCPSHAGSLGADLVIRGPDLEPLWRFLSVTPGDGLPCRTPSSVGVLKLTDGCPFRCTYCSAPILYPDFVCRETEDCLWELRGLILSGVRNVAFYDDALLFRPEDALVPFLEAVVRENLRVAFHTPNALNARLLEPQLADLMVRAGFRTFFLGLESSSYGWQRDTGGKLAAPEFERAVSRLRSAGADLITAYVLVGHPSSDAQEIEATMHFAHRCGARILLSEFAPIPGTPDGEQCRRWADIDEPLSHNKTAFTIRRMGLEEVNRLKELCRNLNAQPLQDSTLQRS